MDPVSIITAWLARSLPAYPADEVARISSELGGAVLWSGPTVIPSAVEASLHKAALMYLLYPASVVAVLAGLHWLVTSYRRHGDSIPVPRQIAIGCLLGLGICMPLVAFLSTDAFENRAAAQASRAVVVTAGRIVEIQGGARTDVPASAVTGVRRLPGAVEIRLADGRLLRVEAAPAEHARLGGALDRLVDSAGQGSRVLGERLG